MHDVHCEFCDEFSGGGRNAFAARYGHELSSRTLLETDHVRVLPTLGHFVKGYLLLVPKLHYCALADMPTEAIHAVQDLQMWLVQHLQPLYGPYIFFEHGARTVTSGGCGIYHAHLHALPLKVEGVLTTLQDRFPHRPIASVLDLRTAEQNNSYLYYEESAGHSWLFFPKVLPSQYLRRLVAESAGISQWDWRRSGREDALIATRYEVLGTLALARYDSQSGLS
jgi:diadenosine tetraphosphate (Ap4A) HIT family hydrolase